MLAPPPHRPDAKLGRRLVIGGEATGAGDDVEEDVPLRAQDHERAEPDLGSETEADDQDHGQREQEIRGKGREELRNRLDLFRQLGAQPDPDADRHPNDRCQGDQNDDAHQRECAVCRAQR